MEVRTVLSITDVSLRFGGVKALSGVSLDVDGGAITGIIGPNGAGKTTLFNCISGLYRPDEGAIHYEGRDLLRLTPDRVAALGIARTFQNVETFADMTVLDTLLVAQHCRIHAGLLSEALGLPVAGRSERQSRRKVADIVGLLGLTGLEATRVADLPFGRKKTVELGRALALEPKLLMLDEPAGGLSGRERRELMDLILALRERLTLTILLVEHDMRFVMGVSHKVVVLNFGEKIAEGSPDAVQSDPRVIEAYLGRQDDGDA